MRVIVTRPQAEAATWVQALQAAGLDAVALPLIDILPLARPPEDSAEVLLAQDFAAWMFVSPNAVRCFLEAHSSESPAERPWTAPESRANPRAWATGPGTRQALLDAGWPAARVDSPAEQARQFDAQALWEVVGEQVRAGDRVLVLQGRDLLAVSPPSAAAAAVQGAGSAWLVQTLKVQGVAVRELAVYARATPLLNATQRQFAQDAANPHAGGAVWLFSSSEGIRNLERALPGQSWQHARCVATHPRIAAAAAQAGFGQVLGCKPLLPEVVAAVRSLGPDL